MGEIALLRQEFARPRSRKKASKRAKADAAIGDLFDPAPGCSPDSPPAGVQPAPPAEAPIAAPPDLAAGPPAEAAPEPGPESTIGRDAPLGCLAGAPLAARFHSWRGASGRRYVCSIFPVRADAELGGLPDFDDAIALAVSSDGRGRRRRLAVIDLVRSEGRFAGDRRAAREALGAGASEWHVHLLAGDGDARRMAIKDIAS